MTLNEATAMMIAEAKGNSGIYWEPKRTSDHDLSVIRQAAAKLVADGRASFVGRGQTMGIVLKDSE